MGHSKFEPFRPSSLRLVVCVLLLACGCSKQETAKVGPSAPAPQMKAAPPTPIDEKRAELGGTRWDPGWDRIVEQALPPELLSNKAPRDVGRFCPRFTEMAEADKRAFWAYFFQALAGAEAGLDPKMRIRHTEPAVAVKDGVTGRAVHSEGLLQLTYEDRERYGCDFDWERDRKLPVNDPAKTILQPKNNLECGVRILAKQIIDGRKPLLSQSSYWSTLRPGGTSYRVFAKQMTNVPEACGLGQKNEAKRRSRRR